jgi:hypothetical protein
MQHRRRFSFAYPKLDSSQLEKKAQRPRIFIFELTCFDIHAQLPKDGMKSYPNSGSSNPMYSVFRRSKLCFRILSSFPF